MDTTTFRVYVYTAVDGYEWQGCAEDRRLAANLDRILSDTGVRNALPDPNVGVTPSSWIGGVLHGELGGRRGVAVWRTHVRSFGERNGRLNRYIALLFLPGDAVDVRRIDFVRIWGAPALAEPRDGDLANVTVDLADPACPCLESAKTSSNQPTIRAAALAKRDEWVAGSLVEMSDAFRSPEAQFGTIVANVRPAKDGTEPRVRLIYTPFPAVEKAAEVGRQLTVVPNERDKALSMAEDADKAAKALRELASAHAGSEALSAFSSSFTAKVKTFRKEAEAIRPPSPPPVPQYQSEPLRPASMALTPQTPASGHAARPTSEFGHRPAQSRHGAAEIESFGRPASDNWRSNMDGGKTSFFGDSGLSSRTPKDDDKSFWHFLVFVASVILNVFLILFLLLYMGKGCSAFPGGNRGGTAIMHLEERPEETSAAIKKLKTELEEEKKKNHELQSLLDATHAEQRPRDSDNK